MGVGNWRISRILGTDKPEVHSRRATKRHCFKTRWEVNVNFWGCPRTVVCIWAHMHRENNRTTTQKCKYKMVEDASQCSPWLAWMKFWFWSSGLFLTTQLNKYTNIIRFREREWRGWQCILGIWIRRPPENDGLSYVWKRYCGGRGLAKKPLHYRSNFQIILQVITKLSHVLFWKG